MADLPSFDVAQGQLVDCLRPVDTCTRLCWVSREDSHAPDRHHVVVPRHVPSSNSALVRRFYDSGVRAGHGLNLHAAFIHDGCAYCWVDVPSDETGAQYCMLSGLKLSRREPLPTVVQVSACSWLWHRIASRAYRRQVHINKLAPLRSSSSRRG